MRVSAIKSGLVLALVAGVLGCYDAPDPLGPEEVSLSGPSLSFEALPPRLAGKAHNDALAHVLRDLTISARRQKFRVEEVIPAAEASLNRYLNLRGGARVNLRELRTAAQPYVGGSQGRVESSGQPITMGYYGSPEGYMNEILDAVHTAFSPVDVEWQVEMILQNAAATLAGADLDGVVEVGSIAVSSSYYWEAEGGAWMGFCSEYVEQCEDQIRLMGWNWRRTAGADVGGAMLGWAFGPGALKVGVAVSLVDGMAQAIEHMVW